MTALGKIEAESLLDRADRVAEVAARHADSVDREGRFPAEAIAAARSERLLGAMIPGEFGGEGASLGEIAEVCATLGRVCGSTALIFAMHQIKMSSVIAHGADHPWHAGLLRRAAEEQMLFASATTEGGIGGDLRNSICCVEADGDRFSLEKDATVISYGAYADAILPTARRSPDAASSDQVLVALLKGQYQLEQTSKWDTLGMRGTCSDGWKLRAVDIPVEQIIPKPFADIAAQSMLVHSHLLWASVWYGIAADAVARAQSFVKAAMRKSPNTTPLGASRVAEAVARLGEMRASIHAALDRYEAAHATPDSLSSVGFAVSVNALKVSASTAVLSIVDDCMMVCGIMGFKNGTPFSLGRHLRDAHSARLMISNDRILANTAGLLPVWRQGRGLAG